jgi:DNA-binding TFAR19-related protein (PDSD5 family)
MQRPADGPDIFLDGQAGAVRTMIETILTALEKSTPALRQRYLDRIRSVRTEEARAIEARLIDLIERDRAHAAS